MECLRYQQQQTKSKKLPSVDEIQATLRKPFPERKRTWLTDAMDLTEWADTMWKGAYPSRKVPVPLYDPTTVVPVQLTADELQAILTKTEIAKTKKLRPRLEAMAAEGRAVELDIHEWSRVLLALCGGGTKEGAGRKRLLGMAKRIADRLAEGLGIEPPVLPVDSSLTAPE